MKRLRFRTIAASPVYGAVQPGQIASVPDEFVDELINGGYAELVEEAQPVRESAMLGAHEKAVLQDTGAKRPRK